MPERRRRGEKKREVWMTTGRRLGEKTGKNRKKTRKNEEKYSNRRFADVVGRNYESRVVLEVM